MSKIRVIQFVVSPAVVIDDGENLIPLEVKPFVIRAADWPRVAPSLPADLVAQVQAQLDAQNGEQNERS